jgi:hypothetical protein
MIPSSVLYHCIVKMAQSFQSGINEIEALAFPNMFLDAAKQEDLEPRSVSYMLVIFHPEVTRHHWRMERGVMTHDNDNGLSPFFPTHLRIEDYIYRLWRQHDDVALAHVDVAPSAQVDWTSHTCISALLTALSLG